MSIKLSPKKEKQATDAVHNSSNTSALEAKDILEYDIYKVLKDIDEEFKQQERAIDREFLEHIENNLGVIFDSLTDTAVEIYRTVPIMINRSRVQEIEKIKLFFESKGNKCEYQLDYCIDMLNVELIIHIKDEVDLLGTNDLHILSDILEQHRLTITSSKKYGGAIILVQFTDVARPMIEVKTK